MNFRRYAVGLTRTNTKAVSIIRPCLPPAATGQAIILPQSSFSSSFPPFVIIIIIILVFSLPRLFPPLSRADCRLSNHPFRHSFVSDLPPPPPLPLPPSLRPPIANFYILSLLATTTAHSPWTRLSSSYHGGHLPVSDSSPPRRSPPPSFQPQDTSSWHVGPGP